MAAMKAAIFTFFSKRNLVACSLELKWLSIQFNRII
ncbi:MAG: hypothetical protein JWQ85_2053 [Mucilaginibacter sp.]|nr:hypothetical protein [Mucilaginibacter sp.]